ncbi:MAG: hypothetical protein HYV08_00615 [Deltaproteobacteria bacterium]|nr:hypothetical protein [Deltaproteobacteria bacterium]MBI3078442.1 hypothetical protein [Deltaproteobacteria bacterium]
MTEIFWVRCPKCKGRFYCDTELRYAGVDLICPFCQTSFDVEKGLETRTAPH